MPLTKIISGGQTGADQGALYAAKELRLETGGTAPKGYRTDEGHNSNLCLDFGLNANTHYSYVPRTRQNVEDSDGTLLFGNLTSPGTRLTASLCSQFKKPT